MAIAYEPDQAEWPRELKLVNDKIYFENRLCVPEALVDQVIMGHHLITSHTGVSKLVKELKLRYNLLIAGDMIEHVKWVKAMCSV